MTLFHESTHKGLRELSRLYDIQTSYFGMRKRRKTARPEALLQALKALGAPIELLADVPAALRERRLAQWRRPVEPVTVAWDGELPPTELRLPEAMVERKVRCVLTFETGETRELTLDLSTLPAIDRVDVEGEAFVRKALRLSDKLPFGYHELRGDSFRTRILSAPRLAYSPGQELERDWGVFLPLYALHSSRSWGAGDFTDLETLLQWTAELGGRVVGTLPMLAAFLEEPFEPSPYSPVSRLFWNEIFIDPTRTPELERSPEARALLESGELQRQIEAARTAPLIDYRRLMALKRRVLEALARSFFDREAGGESGLRRFVDAKPEVEDYARFRAAQERRKEPWPAWPQPLREGSVTPRDYDPRAMQYHLYVQWTAERQVQRLGSKTSPSGTGLYLDLPLGVHPHGYDVWRHQGLFALDASVGAPPDPVFTMGQDWTFPPLHPEAVREQGYLYPVAYLRHQMQHAKLLRIDHVMGLHRLFWIPKGIDASEGVYVSYKAEEQYALLSLESHRNGTGIVGENLGIVPAYVTRTMTRHGLYRIYVLQYAVSPQSASVLQSVPRHTVAALNTHDTPPFEAFLRGDDIEQQRSAGVIEEEDAAQKKGARVAIKAALQKFAGVESPDGEDSSPLLRACLSFLASGPARLVLVNLEDLWHERRPQNVPGFPGLNPDWRRKARLTFEDFSTSDQVRAILRTIHSLRKKKRS